VGEPYAAGYCAAKGALVALTACGGSAVEQPTETEAGPERPSQLNQIRAALADTPTKVAPDLEPGAAPKPKRAPRKPKAS